MDKWIEVVGGLPSASLFSVTDGIECDGCNVLRILGVQISKSKYCVIRLNTQHVKHHAPLCLLHITWPSSHRGPASQRFRCNFKVFRFSRIVYVGLLQFAFHLWDNSIVRYIYVFRGFECFIICAFYLIISQVWFLYRYSRCYEISKLYFLPFTFCLTLDVRHYISVSRRPCHSTNS